MPKKFSTTVTEEQKNDIIESYVNKLETIEQIATRYNKNSKTISHFLKENSIQTNGHASIKLSNQFNKDEKEDIISLYVQNEWTLKQIAEKYNRNSISGIRSTLVEWGVTIRDTQFQQMYKINRNFFKKIDTEEKTYWLGFLYADGSILRKNNNIEGFRSSLSIVDIEHLKKFKKSLDSTHPITTYSLPNTKEEMLEYCSLSISIKEMAEDLVTLGCVPAKSLILEYPTIEQVPIKLQYDFIRGYFDGDGSIYSHSTSKNSYIINIAGTKNFLTGISNFLNIDHSNIIKDSRSELYYYIISNKNGILEFYKKIYQDKTIYLDRKYQRFQDFLNINNL